MSDLVLPRRRFLQGVVAAVAVAHFPLRAEGGLAPNRSGLPWLSGVRSTTSPSDFASWRGCSLDVLSGYSPRDSWDRIRASGSWLKWFARNRAETISIGYPMFPVNHSARTHGPDMWRRGVNGEFDMHHDAAMAGFAAATKNRLILRIGWEWNHSSFPWSCTDVAYSGPYKAYFARIVDIARKRIPSCLIDWCCAKEGKANASVDNWYPGGDHVDILGHDRYDWWPALTTQSAWDRHYYASAKNGGPKGIGAWLNYAKSKGKPMGLGEWGIVTGSPGGGGDNPLFIENMLRFFDANAANIAYEIYFNQNGGTWKHRLYTTEDHPRAAAAYQALLSSARG